MGRATRSPCSRRPPSGLPIVARDIPPVRHAGVERLAATPIELAQQVLALDDLDRWRKAMTESADVRVADGGHVAGRGPPRRSTAWSRWRDESLEPTTAASGFSASR